MGFEWTYEGKEPRQLALAILAEHLNDDAKALKMSQHFMTSVIADLDNDWRLSSDEIDAALTGMG